MANKNDIVAEVIKSTGLSRKDCSLAVNAVLTAITDYLKKGEKVQLIGFGNFIVRERAARKGRNPQTGQELTIDPTKVPAFKAGKLLKDAVQ